MRIVIVNKSDSTGGAAVVSFRLMMALRAIGADARMLVAEKLTDSPYVETAAPSWRLKGTFLADRLRIALANGFDRSTLFKLDAAVAGIDIMRHPLVREADAIFLNWINQGLLSLDDIRRIGASGKRVVWTMHDMWNLTGICHHAGECSRFEWPGRCGDCPLLGRHGGPHDLSFTTHGRKERLYAGMGIDFVAVSSWLAEKAASSTLLGRQRVSVIPNAFHLPAPEDIQREDQPGKLRLIFGAARLDDDVKGFPVFIEAMRQLERDYPELAAHAEVTLYGGIRDSSLMDGIPLPLRYMGILRDPGEIAALYCRNDVVVSTSLFETLPGTLVEGQAYGCIPVTFGRGGQRDIIEHGVTGLIAEWNDDPAQGAASIASAIVEAARMLDADARGIRRRMYHSVKTRFDALAVARAYLGLVSSPEP